VLEVFDEGKMSKIVVCFKNTYLSNQGGFQKKTIAGKMMKIERTSAESGF
jgi:hypothetical protein